MTDHIALTALKKSRFANPRIYRWSLLIQEYDFDIYHQPGRNNVKADALSRIEEKNGNPNHIQINSYNLQEADKGYNREDVVQIQENPELGEIKQKIRENGRYKGHTFNEGILYKQIGQNNLIVLNQQKASAIIKKLLETFGHMGKKK